jgi:glycosyltransferase involved in cell wall biosynthesis
MNTIQACVVIPVYNHEHAIVRVLNDIHQFNLPCILIDDGSDASCRAVLKNYADENSDWVALQCLPSNQGKGEAVMAGLFLAEQLGYSHAIQIDADGQHCISDIPKFIQSAELEPDTLIAGIPIFDQSVPKARLYGRYLTHIWVWINTLSLSIKDSMCGFRIYPINSTVQLLRKTKIGSRMDFDTEILVRLYWQGLTIRQIPTAVQYPIDGVSHFQVWRDNVLISRMHAKLFFGMLIRSPRLLLQKFRR